MHSGVGEPSGRGNILVATSTPHFSTTQGVAAVVRVAMLLQMQA